MIRADATGLKKSLCTGMGAQRPRGEYTAYAFRVLRRDGEEAPIAVSRRRHRVRRISPHRRHADDDVRISRRDAKDVQPGVGYFIYARRAGTARPVLWHCTRFDGR